MIVDARNNMRSDHLLAAMVVVGAIGLILDLLIARAELSILKFWGQTDVH
jgi:NitT/TauT family transport system permease protein